MCVCGCLGARLYVLLFSFLLQASLVTLHSPLDVLFYCLRNRQRRRKNMAIAIGIEVEVDVEKLG